MSALVGLWALVALAFTLVAIDALRRLDARRAAPPALWPRLAIVRPCEGLDPGLEENLLSSLTARYDGARALYVCVPSLDDPAAAVAARVERAARVFAPSVPVSLVVTAIETPANRKAAQLAVAEQKLDAPVVVVADSDVRFDDRTLPELIGALEADPRAAAASAPPIDVEAETLGDRASAALLSSTPNALRALAALSSGWRGHPLLAGALVACRREALAEAGGFAALEPYLGEDFELARRLHAAGHTLATSSAPARFTDRGRSLYQVVRRYARWAMVVRRQRPGLLSTYWLLLACTPVLVVLAALAAVVEAPRWPAAVAATVLLLGARAAFARRLRRGYGLRDGWLRSVGALLIGELLILVSSIRSLGRAEVEWRGRRFHVRPGGVLERIRVTASASPPARPAAPPAP
jgi:ceramide glucosyltransferase